MSRRMFDSILGRSSLWLCWAYPSVIVPAPAGVLGRAAAFDVPPAISLDGFHDGAQHWRNIRDDSRVIRPLPGQASHSPAETGSIAENILLFQRDNGGWPKDYDMAAVLTDAQKEALRATRHREDTSFDNGNIHSQVAYLARAYTLRPEPAWHAACERGFDFILAAQYANGGFPQRYPKPTGFHAHITFNDYVMIGCMNVLRDAADGAPHFGWLDDQRRRRAADAVERGIQCIVKCQIRVDGRLTGWCQQHDEKTYEPRPGRTFELASICPQDTTETVRFLMRERPPRPEVRQAIEAAVAWLRRVPLAGVRVEKVAAPKVDFQRHSADFDKVLLTDAAAPPLWARHYEIGSDRPVFAGRDGVKKYALAEIERERRTGTPWYGTWPQRLLDKEYPAWQAASGR